MKCFSCVREHRIGAILLTQARLNNPSIPLSRRSEASRGTLPHNIALKVCYPIQKHCTYHTFCCRPLWAWYPQPNPHSSLAHEFEIHPRRFRQPYTSSGSSTGDAEPSSSPIFSVANGPRSPRTTQWECRCHSARPWSAYWSYEREQKIQPEALIEHLECFDNRRNSLPH
jgi:hypothetical protein